MSQTEIAWAEKVWNPITGCTPVSEGCQKCYAKVMAKRLQAMGMEKYRHGFLVVVHDQPKYMEIPLRKTKPTLFFVNSMSDLFHRDVSDTVIKKIFKIMNDCPQHQFLVLTKRDERLASVEGMVEYTPNIWLGVTVELQKYYERIQNLIKTSAFIKFLSLEPLLGPMPDLPLEGIDWVITGGESGQGYRKMKIKWAKDVRDQCIEHRIAFFHKQHGGVGKCKCHNAKGCLLLDGKVWNDYPMGKIVSCGSGLSKYLKKG